MTAWIMLSFWSKFPLCYLCIIYKSKKNGHLFSIYSVFNFKSKIEF